MCWSRVGTEDSSPRSGLGISWASLHLQIKGPFESQILKMGTHCTIYNSCWWLLLLRLYERDPSKGIEKKWDGRKIMLLHNCFLHLYHFLANISHSNAKVFSSPEKLSRNLLTRKSTEIFFLPPHITDVLWTSVKFLGRAQYFCERIQKHWNIFCFLSCHFIYHHHIPLKGV